MRSKRAIKNIIISVLLQIITLICGFIVPKLLISSFGSNVNGLVSSITQFLAYITLLESGMGAVVKSALYKPLSEKNNEKISNILYATERFFKKVAIIFLAYIIVLCIIFPIIVHAEFSSIFTISLIIIIAISIFAEYYFGMTYRLFLKANQEAYVVSYIQIITTVINAIAVVILVKVGVSIQIVKLTSAIIFIMRPIAQNIYVKRKYKLNIKKADRSYKLEQKWNGLSQHIAAVIHDNTDIAVLTIFSNFAEVSVYSVYALIIKGIKNLVDSLMGGMDAAFGDMIAKNEIKTLNESFKSYELFYYTIITIIFICTIVLITPFVSVYTSGISDVNYIRPLFGFLIVISEFIFAIRIPYNTLALSAGHFKQTMKGAWVEAVTNIIISIILVYKFGIVGVAIGTLVAMLIRTSEFIYYSSKKILYRSIWYSIKWILIIVANMIIVLTINNLIKPYFVINSYMSWIKYAICIGTIATLIVLVNDIIFHRSELKEVLTKIKKISNLKQAHF